MADLASPPPLEKISISGATLASILHRFSASPGDIQGLLFGHFIRLPPPLPNDDDDLLAPTSPSEAPLAATISGHISVLFFDSVGRAAAAAKPNPLFSSANRRVIGWFSARRRSPLHPSMRELAASLSLRDTLGSPNPEDVRSPPPLIFLLLSFNTTPNRAIHTHEYRAFVLPSTNKNFFEPKSLHIINLGPGFREQYNDFSPGCALPRVPCPLREVDNAAVECKETLIGLKATTKDKEMLVAFAEGFGFDGLKKLAGAESVQYASYMEELYRKMLLKLKSLAGLVEESSSRVLEQENRNIKLRNKIARLD